MEHGVRRAVNVIIRVDGTPYGVLETDTSDAGPYNAADSDFCKASRTCSARRSDGSIWSRSCSARKRCWKKACSTNICSRLEIHHRVKNSLALVISMLNMTQRASQGETVDDVLEVARDRVHAIADVHDHLARYGKGERAPLDVFIGDLCKRIAVAHPEQRLVWTVEAIEVSADNAVSLGIARKRAGHQCAQIRLYRSKRRSARLDPL